MSSDVALTEEGQRRAAALRDSMKNKKISVVFSTATIRTRSTAKPTADQFHLLIQSYGPIPDSSFVAKLRSLKKNVLVVGHSNTVDDIVNGLTGTNSVPSDLEDNQYDNLYVVRVKGKKVIFQKKNYGLPSKK
jgi:broad specificity phosphatase PhoE